MNSLRPLRGYVILRLDPQPTTAGSLHLPDQDYMDTCSRCGAILAELERPCLPELVFKWDASGRIPEQLGYSYHHQLERVVQTVMPNATQPATVWASAVQPFIRGDRVLVSWGAGDSLGQDDQDLWRRVSADEIIAYVVEE